MEQFGSYSDFNFTNIFAWTKEGGLSISWLNGNLVLHLKDYITGEDTYSLCGKNKIDDTLETLLNSCDKLRLVPVAVRKSSISDNFIFEEDRDAFDYVYRVEDVTKMAGSNYKKKRNKIQKVNSYLIDNLEIVHTMSPDDDEKKVMIEVFQKWAEDNDRSKQQIELERIALQRVIDNSRGLNCLFTLIKHNNKTIAFSVNELLWRGYSLCHFEKAIKVHDNIFSYVAYLVAIELRDMGVESMNWEQDLGLPGLRMAKESFYPVHFLKKYTVYKKQ
jgi:hypothetical protein